jgi:hypothetical protein
MGTPLERILPFRSGCTDIARPTQPAVADERNRSCKQVGHLNQIAVLVIDALQHAMLEFVFVDGAIFGLELLKVPAFDCLAQCHDVVPCSGVHLASKIDHF